METITDPQLDAPTAEAARSISRIVVPTGLDDDHLDLTRRVATRLAARFDWHVVLYDRSGERWADTPHPSGPHTVDDPALDDRPALVRQMRDMEAAGVSVSAWLATLPSITALIDVLQELDVDGVVMPEEQDKARFVDRLLPGSDPVDAVGRVADNLPDHSPTFLVVADDGSVTVERRPG